MFELIPYERFRDTPAVRFFDVTIDSSNARDLVIHSGPAISPPNDTKTGDWQFYLHPHQEDNLLAAGGDILRIPPGTFHRSISDLDGSVVLNQAVREQGASLTREFRVYNSGRIPALRLVTTKGAIRPVLHGVEPLLQAA